MPKKDSHLLYGTDTWNTILFRNRQQSRYPVLVGTPCTGLVRMEWAVARFCQYIPCNWSYKFIVSWMSPYAPMGYLVADAQNLIVGHFLEQKSDWLLLHEQDNVLMPDCYIRLAHYVRSGKIPVVSGLYFTKSVPPEPLIYRGRGNSYFRDWKMGDRVWCDGVPTGCLLIHRSILEVLWEESPSYQAGDRPARRVFAQPERVWHDPEQGWESATGTSDLEFCSRLIEGRIFEKAGWPKFQKKKYPLLVDTKIFSQHIDEDGKQYPLGGIPREFEPAKKRNRRS